MELWPKLSWSVQTLIYHLVKAYSKEKDEGEVDLGSLDRGGVDVKSKGGKADAKVCDFQQFFTPTDHFSEKPLTPRDGVQDEPVKGGIPKTTSEEAGE